MAPENKERENEPFLTKYQDEDNTSTNGSEPDQNYTPKSKTRFLPYILTIIITSMLWMSILLISSTPSFTNHWNPPPSQLKSPSYYNAHKHNITSNSHLMTCGNTTAVARANNCKYDILLNSWIPNPCYDTEFVEEYTDDASWGAYADKELTVKLTNVDEMSEMEFYYTSMRDHVNHCATIWKKQFWVMFEERGEVDTIVAGPGHTDHCAQFLMDVADMDWTKATKVTRAFAGCWVKN